MGALELLVDFVGGLLKRALDIPTATTKPVVGQLGKANKWSWVGLLAPLQGLLLLELVALEAPAAGPHAPLVVERAELARLVLARAGGHARAPLGELLAHLVERLELGRVAHVQRAAVEAVVVQLEFGRSIANNKIEITIGSLCLMRRRR